MDDFKLAQEAQRGQNALSVLTNDVYQEAYQQQRDEYIRQWIESPARDVEGREFIWKLLKNLDAVDAHLRTVMETGKMAVITINETTKLIEQNRAFQRDPYL